MKDYSTIFFDLDGTLTRSGDGIMNGVAYALRSIGIEEDRREVLQSFIGPPLIRRFMEVYGVDQDTAKELQAIYRKYYTETGVYENALYEGVPEMLSRFRDAGRTLVIATSKPHMYVDIVVDRFGIREYFDFIASADLDAGRSTKTQVLDYAFGSLQITDRSAVILVGDRMYDAIGAREAGIDCMGVLYGYGSREELEREGVICIAETVPEIASILL